VGQAGERSLRFAVALPATANYIDPTPEKVDTSAILSALRHFIRFGTPLTDAEFLSESKMRNVMRWSLCSVVG